MPTRPHLVFSAWIVLALVAGWRSAGADDKDPIRDKLVAAKTTYDNETKQFQKQVADWLTAREDAARKAGDKKLLDQVKTERKGLEEDEILPKSLPVALKQKQDRARKAMDAAYAEAVKAYTKAKKDTEAAAVEEAWKEFAAGGGAIDLLALVDPKMHTLAGEWKKERGMLVGTGGETKFAWLQLPYEPSEEYDVEVSCKRLEGNDSLGLGLVSGGRQVLASIDSWSERGGRTGLDLVDMKEVVDNSTTVKGHLLKSGQKFAITYSVRQGKIEISIDKKVVTAFKGESTALSLQQGFTPPNTKALFLIIGQKNSFQIDRIAVTPVKGKGTILK